MESTKNEDSILKHPYKCFTCKVHFSGVEEFCRHIDLCFESFNSHDNDNNVVKRKTAKQKRYQCRKCSKSFENRPDYDTHWSLHHPDASKLLMYENAHLCIPCKLVFKKFTSLQMHQKSARCVGDAKDVASLPNVISDGIKQNATLRYINGAHGVQDDCIAKRKVVQERPLHCSQCVKSFYNSREYDRHWSVHHQDVSKMVMYENPHPCNPCQLIFKSVIALHVHQTSARCVLNSKNTAPLPNQISEHGTNAVKQNNDTIGFKNIGNGENADNVAKRKVHLEKSFLCSQCSKSFWDGQIYNRHWSIHHMDVSKLLMYEYPHPCKPCQLVFKSLTALQSHQMSGICVGNSKVVPSLNDSISECITSVIEQINAGSPKNELFNTLAQLNAYETNENVKHKLTICENVDNQNNACGCSNCNKDSKSNKLLNNSGNHSDGALPIGSCIPPYEFATFGDGNLFDSLGIGISTENGVVFETCKSINNDSPINNLNGFHHACQTTVPMELPKSCLTECNVEELFQNSAPYLPMNEMLPNTDVEERFDNQMSYLPINQVHHCADIATENGRVLETKKHSIQCRICRLNFDTLKRYKKHFLDAHSNYATDDMFDDGWKCTLCSSVYIDINGLETHWIKKHGEFYSKEQFKEFVKQNGFCN